MNTQLIEKIRAGTFAEKELISLHNNARDRHAFEVVAVIERQMRTQFPKAASRVFGKKEALAIQRLQEAVALLRGQAALSASRVKYGVRPGGPRPAEEKYINVYVAYHTQGGDHGFLSMEQETIDTELLAVVGRYRIGADRFRSERTYTMDAFKDAADDYVAIATEAATSEPQGAQPR